MTTVTLDTLHKSAQDRLSEATERRDYFRNRLIETAADGATPKRFHLLRMLQLNAYLMSVAEADIENAATAGKGR